MVFESRLGSKLTGVAPIIFAYYAVLAEGTATLAKPLSSSVPGSGIDHPTSRPGPGTSGTREPIRSSHVVSKQAGYKPDKADGGSISCRRFLEREGREGGNAAIVYRDRLRGNRSGVPEIPCGGKLRRLGPPWPTLSNGRAQ